MSDPILYRATHVTRYLYERAVSQCLSESRLTPRDSGSQRLFDFRLDIEPEPDMLDRRTDYFGNEVHALSILKTHERFITTATSIVEVNRPEPGVLPEIPWETARTLIADYADEDTRTAYEFTFESPFVSINQELANWTRKTFTPARPLGEAVLELSDRVHSEFSYKPRSTTIDMPLSEVFRNRQGVCQDFAHVLIGALRSVRLSARYVSGYLRSGAQYSGAEASHAWVSVFLPGYGWLDLDPTNRVIPQQGHVEVAIGRDYGDVTPVNGIALGGGRQLVEVEVKVVPV